MERLIKIGEVEKKHSLDVKSSRIGIGFEKLDRNVFDPEKAYDKVAELGIKWIRLQSGWERTETKKGFYDFEWIDSIVDNLLKRGLIPWLCLCYGHGMYDEMAAKIFGAVGCPPVYTEEQKTAWNNYVKAIVSHFKNKVTYYEVWNEPDGDHCWKHGMNAHEYAQFVIDTSRAIKSANPEAKVIGGAVCNGYDNTFTVKLLNDGIADYIDAYSFHEYTPDETSVPRRVGAFRGIFNLKKPDIELIQGESGSQSRSDGSGALWGASWTELKQAKQLLRHTVIDLTTEVKFTSYFTCMDMIEALFGTRGDKSSYQDYGYFGVLGAKFDENGFAVGEYYKKQSYTALQCLCSIFSDEYETVTMPILLRRLHSNRLIATEKIEPSYITGGFKRKNGGYAYVYWNATDLLTATYESTISIQASLLPNDIKLIDPLTGNIYTFPENMLDYSDENCVTITNAPICDYPLIITFGEF